MRLSKEFRVFGREAVASRIAFLVLLTLSTSGVAFAQQRTLLRADVDSIFPNVRSGAPIPMNWTVEWGGSGLLEGHIHIELFNYGKKFGEFRSHDMVLTAGQQRFSMLLPPINDLEVFATLDVHTKFVTEDKTYDLGILARRVPGNRDRSFSLCASDPWSMTPGSWFSGLVQKIHIVAISPVDVRESLSALPTYVIPDEMPNDPISYCGFDVVVLSGDGFAEMGQKRLSVLQDWVNAGGSLCIIPTGLLTTRHITLLNELVGADNDDPPFLLDSTGKLMGADDWDAKPEVRTFRKGLGRVAIILGQPDEEFDWNETTAFLWKLRRDQTENLKAKGAWVAPARPEISDYERDYSTLDAGSFQVLPLQTISHLIERLMPEGVRVVPLSLIALMLIVYVAVIGPGDYFLLGMLNLRKFTWIFFPAVTIAFTVFTVWLSHVYMSSASTRKAAVFLDVIEGGKIARRSRVELMFPASHQVYESEVRHSLFTALNHRRFGDTEYTYTPNYDVRQLVETGTYTGRVPTQYTVVQELSQWSPQLNRVFSIAPEDETTEFPWDQFQGQRFDAVNRAELAEQVQEAFGVNAIACVIDSNRTVIGSPILSTSTGGYPYGQTVYRDQTRFGQVSTFLLDVCARNQQGMFFVISQLSPTGGNNFEDLSLLDITEPHQWLLVIAVPKGDDLLIYRRLYHGDG